MSAPRRGACIATSTAHLETGARQVLRRRTRSPGKRRGVIDPKGHAARRRQRPLQIGIDARTPSLQHTADGAMDCRGRVRETITRARSHSSVG